MQTYKEHIRVSDFEAAAFMLLKCAEEMMHQIKFKNTGVKKDRIVNEMEEIFLRYILPDY
jgi:hypothetical protein